MICNQAHTIRTTVHKIHTNTACFDTAHLHLRFSLTTPPPASLRVYPAHDLVLDEEGVMDFSVNLTGLCSAVLGCEHTAQHVPTQQHSPLSLHLLILY